MKMRSDTDHREQLDDFSEFMRQKLEDHRLPIDDLCWEEIESRAKSRQTKWLWWAGSSVAAAVIAFLFLFPPFQAGDRFHEVPPMASVQVEEEMHQDTEKNVIQKETVPAVDQPVPTKKLIAAVTSKKTQEREMPEAEVFVEADEQDEAAREAVVGKNQTDSGKESKKREKQQDLYTYESKRYKFSSGSGNKKSEGKWSVNAGFGTGGHVSLGLGDLARDPQNNFQENPDPGIGFPPPVKPPSFNSSGVLPPEEYTNVDAALPLSFGVTIRRDFNRYIGLETGLVYTYLSSNLTKWDQIQFKSRLELHYLGIPVNLVVNLWQNPRWNIYLSGGFMLEKGLRAKQTEDRFWQMEMNNNVDKRGISRLQWSLNASAGVSYRFYRNWSFYFEPRISHYFDNDQPRSIRTENSVIIGLGAGVRLGF